LVFEGKNLREITETITIKTEYAIITSLQELRINGRSWNSNWMYRKIETKNAAIPKDKNINPPTKISLITSRIPKIIHVSFKNIK
jgi:hypothetical protein